jgi:hypothetical protein
VWWDTRNKLNAGEQARPMAEVLHRTMELSCSTKIKAGISRIIMEMDSANLAAALRSNIFDQSPGRVIYREARHLLGLHFVLVDICVVPRSCNKCAHQLAHSGLARDPGAPSVWSDPLPNFVSDMVSRDFTDSPVN